LFRSETLAWVVSEKSRDLWGGTGLALLCHILMARRRADQAPVGVTSNGVLIVNILGLLSAREAQKLRRALPLRLGEDWFVGTAIKGREVVRMLARFDDAAAEAAAQLAGRTRHTAAAKRKK
jgi:hypothetical protein